MSADPTPQTIVRPPEPAPTRRLGLFARRRVRPVVASVVALACALVIAGLGYFVIYPQVDAYFRERRAREEIENYDFAAARADLERCLRIRPNSAELHFLLARTCRRAGDLDAARGHLSEAKRLSWVAEEIRLEYLLLQAQAFLVPRVEQPLREYLERGAAEETLILEALADGSLAINRLSDAQRWTSIWIRRHPDDWHGHYWQGRVYDAGLRYTLAAEEFQKVLQTNPGYREAHLRLAVNLFKDNRFDEAVPHFDKYLEGDPHDPYALLGLARCQRILGQPDVAVATLERVIATETDYVPALALRGQLELDRDNPEGALVWLRRAYKLNPSYKAANQAMAAALTLLGKGQEAQRYARRGREIELAYVRVDALTKQSLTDPTDVATRREAGAILFELGHRQEALRWLVGALLLDPNDQETKKALRQCLHQLGDPDLEERYGPVLEDRATELSPDRTEQGTSR
ncbi:MAG TPA: tetratricopeptide repeat protein [Gemmataceae bacterium]|nr:tetratricopeptide repeat protein [Gemmataceae bacterium]